MIEKEIRDTLKVLAQSLLILLVIPVMMMLDWHVIHSQWELSGILQPVFMVFLIVVAAFSGVSVFHVEKKERALEYMFSLPVSKARIMMNKLAPRLAALMILISMGIILGVLKSPVIDTINLLVVFVTAVCISLAVESMVNAMVGVIFVNIVIYNMALVLIYLFYQGEVFASETLIVVLAQVLAVAAVLTPLVIAFVRTVKHFDLKPLKWQAKSYLTIALPSMGVVMLFVLVFLKKYLAWIKEIG